MNLIIIPIILLCVINLMQAREINSLKKDVNELKKIIDDVY